MNQNANYNEDWIQSGKFDYLIIGSGLCESMVAYLLAASDSSPTVLQVDPNNFYGQSWASFQPEQLESISSKSVSTSHPFSVQPLSSNIKSSSYAISLQPCLVPARGKFVDLLISSNVAPYLSFQLLHAFILAQPNDTFLPLPASKHDLFRMSDLSLVDKRLLMRFFQSTVQPDPSPSPEPDQSLVDYLTQPPFSITNPRLSSIIASLSLSMTASSTAQGVLDRLRTILSAIGRHPSPTISALPAAILLGEYGGAGDWAEGFVRAAAVTGRAVQVIGRPILSLQQPSEHHPNWSIRLGPQINHLVSAEAEDSLEFSAGKLLISQEYSSFVNPDLVTPKAYTVLRGIGIIDQPGLLDKLKHTTQANIQPATSNLSSSHGLIVFPPEVGLCDNPIHAVVVGPDSGSCPGDEQIIYLTTTVPANIADDKLIDPSKVLKPILNKLLITGSASDFISTLNKTENHPLKFECFYTQSIFKLPESTEIPTNKKLLVIPSWPTDIEKFSFVHVVESLVDEAQNLSKLAGNL